MDPSYLNSLGVSFRLDSREERSLLGPPDRRMLANTSKAASGARVEVESSGEVAPEEVDCSRPVGEAAGDCVVCRSMSPAVNLRSVGENLKHLFMVGEVEARVVAHPHVHPPAVAELFEPPDGRAHLDDPLSVDLALVEGGVLGVGPVGNRGFGEDRVGDRDDEFVLAPVGRHRSLERRPGAEDRGLHVILKPRGRIHQMPGR